MTFPEFWLTLPLISCLLTSPSFPLVLKAIVSKDFPNSPELLHFWIDSLMVNEIIYSLCGKCPSMEVERLRERLW